MRLLDRMLSRASYDNYNEYLYSGTYQVSASDPDGRYKEGVPAGTARCALHTELRKSGDGRWTRL